MRIRDVFRNPIDRRIEEVIKVDLGNEETVAYEISEYVVTDHLRREFEKVLDVFQETTYKPSETATVWVSGFFGSGKSSFAKVLGYVLDNPTVQGRPAVDRFLERVPDERLRALLSTIHAQAPCLSVFVDLSTARYVLREGESMVLPLYRAVLDRLGYSRDILLAELEYNLEGDGDLQAFERAFEEITGRQWSERRHVALARNEASHALSLLRPETYPASDSYVRGAREPIVTADWFTERLLELMKRRTGGKRRLVFIVDEVGQYVARSEQRMYDLMGLAHAVQKNRGAIWLVVTSQERLEDIVDSLEGRRVELARVRDRFPITVDLVPSDIEEIVSRRILDKTADGADMVRTIFRTHRNRLTENTRLDSPTRQRPFSEDEFIRMYPLLPYQVQLFIDAVSAHRGRGGAGPMLGGSNRTLIKLSQQLIVHPETALGEQDVGALVTAPMGYDLLKGITPTAWQAEIDRVASRHSRRGTPTKVAKAIALLSGVRGLKLEAANLGALLHPAVGAESLRSEVDAALQVLVQEEVVRRGEEGYKLQSPEEKSWERERQSIDMKPAAWHRMRRELIKQFFEGLAIDAGRTFRIGATANGDRLVEGNLEVVVEEAGRSTYDDLRTRSRDKKHLLFWAYESGDETLELACELHRSTEMVKRREGASRSPTEVQLLGEERLRMEQLEKRLRDQFESDLLAGMVFFEGIEEEPRGGDFRTALKESLVGKIDKIYPRLHEFTAPARREDARVVLRSESLEGLPAYLRDDGLGVLRSTPDGLTIGINAEPLATVLAEIKDRSAYGLEATGKYLEDKFGNPPFGAVVEVVQVLLALLLRAGTIEVLTQGVRVTNPRDPRVEKAFGTLPSFRTTVFAPQREVDLDMRTRVAKRLQQLTGEREPIVAQHLASRLREFYRSYSEILTGVTASLRALGLPVPESVERSGSFAKSFASATDEETIKTCDEAWEDLRQGLQTVQKWHDALNEETLNMLRQAKQISQRGSVGLGPEETERLTQLGDLLRGPDLVAHLGTVGRLVAEQEQAYRNAWEMVRQDLLEEIRARATALRERYANILQDAALDEMMKPLIDLLPAEQASPEAGLDLETLRAHLARLPGLAAQIESDLAAMASRTEVARIRLRELCSRTVTSEEELETLIERLRRAALEALAQGKHILLE